MKKKRPRIRIRLESGSLSPQPPQPVRQPDLSDGIIQAEGRMLDQCPVKLVDRIGQTLLVELVEDYGTRKKGDRVEVGPAEFIPK